MNESKLLLDFRSFHLLPKLSFWLLLRTGGYGRQNERVGSWMEVEWKVPLRSAHVHLMEIHERKYSMSSCGHFYLRPNKHPSTPLHKHDSHLLPHKFILSNEPPVLPLYICDYGIFHLRPQKLPFTPMGSNIVRTPFELLPPTSFPF